MRVKDNVPVFTAATESVEQTKAFEYWRDTVMTAADVTPFDSAAPFAASRMVAASAHGTLLRTVSSPIGVNRNARHIRHDGRDDLSIMLIVAGQGYIEQGDTGTLVQAGDVAFHAMGQPGTAGSRDGYEEIRLAVPLAAFLARVGNTQDVVGRMLGATPSRGLLAAFLTAFATSVSSMSEVEAGIAVEGVLHLLRGIIRGQTEPADGKLSGEAVRALALAHIQRRLHEPEFGPASLAKALRISRIRLYAAFAGG